MTYDFKKIEKRWQDKWEEKKIFQVKEGKKKKFYVLEMFPYPSGSGLHMGHALNYTIGDIYARFKRMNGFNVLYPAGYDSLGLPAENAAIKKGIHPKKYTEKSIKNFIKQQKFLGLSYDWSRMVKTSDPEFYKWDQWIFLKMFEKGLAYKKKSSVNWCPKCQTVLANEQVHSGMCWRHKKTEVELKQLEQWFFKITDYADELFEDIKKLKAWSEDVKAMQRNWIGKSHGTDIYFKLEGSSKILPTYTTRCDTIYSVTFLAIAPEHPELMDFVTDNQKEEVEKFVKKVKKESNIDRENEEKEKEGVFTGKYAINPVNNEKIPIYVSNFALMYGSGIVMCDAHDKRDFRFALKYKIPLKFVISKDGKSIDPKDYKDAQVEDGILFGSGKFNGMKNKEALPKISKWLEDKKWGKRTINYKLKDWLISRQRYWGTPLPIVYCDKCGIVPVPEKDLPIKLPEKVKFGKGNPLETAKSWYETKCPKCKGKAKRETDTMDTFVNSSWYFLRYADPKNNKKIFDIKKANYWVPIDQYIGGKEHACMHLIYFRFYTKFLRDLGLLKIDEPTLNLFNQGMLHGEDGFVMSKSRGNVVLPEEVSKKYGIDTARFFLVSMASPDKDVQWTEKGIRGSFRFTKKVIDYFNKVKIGKADARIESKLNKTIKNVTDYIENFKYNLAVIELRSLFDSLPEKTSKDILEKSLKLLSPFCPHIAEELWNKLGNKTFISVEKWPIANLKKINEKFEKEDEMISKLRSDIENIKSILKKPNAKVYVYVLPKEVETYQSIDGINLFAVNDKKKYDPENKSKKVKPGRPGIYLE